ncbi:MAG: phosphatase PAP2 family protein [Patescibacteria group bacterium]
MPISANLAIFLAEYLIYFSALVVPYLLIKRQTHDLIRIAVSVMVAFTVSELIKYVAAVPRPFVVENFEPLISLSPREFYGSFPSGHATFMGVLAMGLFFKDKTAGIVVFLAGLLVGWGRVLVGVHYPLDIAAGLVLGAVVSTFFKYVHDKSPVW